MTALAAAGLAAGADLIGGMIGMHGQSTANRQNLQIAREQMAFQERMSGSAYQRATKDLEAAGLNRILALGSPSSTPSGQTARMENVKAPLARGVSQAAHSAAALAKNAAEIKNINATTDNTEQNTLLAGQRTLIATHGAEIASVGADIVRVVRELTGNKNPKEIAALLKSQIEKARAGLTNILEQYSSTTKGVTDRLDTIIDDVYNFGMRNLVNPIQEFGTGLSRDYDAIQEQRVRDRAERANRPRKPTQ